MTTEQNTTTEQVFIKIVSHVISGIMMHQDLANYFAFLGLHKYEAEQRKHYREESKLLDKIHSHYISTYCKLLPSTKVDIPKYIPDTMFNHVTEDLGTNDVRQAVKTIFKTWVDWEEETKQLFEDSYIKLLNSSAVCSSMFLKSMVKDVNEELAEARRVWLTSKFTNFDIVKIMEEN